MNLVFFSSSHYNIMFFRLKPPKPPKPAERSKRGRKTKPVKSKFSKEIIGGPQDFQHNFHVRASSTSPDAQRFHFIESK